MANPYHHALSSCKKWGGQPEDYQAIHDWFDASKEMWSDSRHVKEDCGFIPSIADWFCNIKLQRWMGEPPAKLEDELAA